MVEICDRCKCTKKDASFLCYGGHHHSFSNDKEGVDYENWSWKSKRRSVINKYIHKRNIYI